MANLKNDAVQEIKSNLSPAEVIESYTGQKAQHNKYICPFHPDKHPSLSVKGEHWKCWSCEASGDVIDFVQEYFQLDFISALIKLADDFGIEIDAPEPTQMDPLEKLGKIIEMESKDFYTKQLKARKQEIADLISRLTDTHRILIQNGASDEILKEYAEEIDSLIELESKL